ncbi:type II toxin-antitoxin system RelE/ParE family toxin [Candidatus Saccharibacteria bacterium]|nr:type II toxin-antitoxin system RelE/ParE family toxin [Candidatus Saccharibacteria bacterium]
MKKYSVVYTKQARNDLADIYDYIAVVCNNRPGAEKVLRQISKKCAMLATMPKFAQIKIECRGLEFRTVRAGKYMAAYCVDDDNSAVIIYRILHVKMNLAKQLFSN